MSDIPAKSRWIRKGSTSGQIIRVMGTVEGWVVARYKGCAPFMLHQNDWPKKYEPAKAAGIPVREG
jgi:hypothetical protein